MPKPLFIFSVLLFLAFSSCSFFKDQRENYNKMLVNKTLFFVDSIEGSLKANTYCGKGAFKLVFRPDSIYISHKHSPSSGTWYSIVSLSGDNYFQKIKLNSKTSGAVLLEVSYGGAYTVNLAEEGLGWFADSLEVGQLFTFYKDPTCQEIIEPSENDLIGHLKNLLHSANTSLKTLSKQDWDIDIDYSDDGTFKIKAYLYAERELLGNFTYDLEKRSLKQVSNLQELSFNKRNAENLEKKLGITASLAKLNCFPDSVDVSLPISDRGLYGYNQYRNVKCAFNSLEQFRCSYYPIDYYLISPRVGFTYAVFPQSCGDSEYKTLVTIKDGVVIDMLLIERVQEAEINEEMGFLYTDFSMDTEYKIHLKHSSTTHGFDSRELTKEEDFFLNEDGKFEKL